MIAELNSPRRQNAGPLDPALWRSCATACGPQFFQSRLDHRNLFLNLGDRLAVVECAPLTLPMFKIGGQALTVRSQLFERLAIVQADVTIDNQFDRAGHAL